MVGLPERERRLFREVDQHNVGIAYRHIGIGNPGQLLQTLSRLLRVAFENGIAGSETQLRVNLSRLGVTVTGELDRRNLETRIRGNRVERAMHPRVGAM